MKKYTELFTLPLGILLFGLFNWIGQRNGWHLYGAGVFQKLFLGLVLFLLVIALARIIFGLTFPTLYKYIDKDFDQNNQWNVLSPRERTWAGLLLLCVYFLIFALLVANL